MDQPTTTSRAVPASGAGERRAIAAVATGGALGAAARWAVGQVTSGKGGLDVAGTFAWGTLTANVLGCLLIGIVAGRIERNSIGWAFAVTGGLGGFTTMSAFAVELNEIADAGRNVVMVAYLAATLLGGALAFFIGERSTRRHGDASTDHVGEGAT